QQAPPGSAGRGPRAARWTTPSLVRAGSTHLSLCRPRSDAQSLSRHACWRTIMLHADRDGVSATDLLALFIAFICPHLRHGSHQWVCKKPTAAPGRRSLTIFLLSVSAALHFRARLLDQA